MKTLSIDEIVREVRIKIDEMIANDSELMNQESDSVNLVSVIKSCISEGYRMVSMLADVSMLEGKDGSSASLSIDTNLVGHITLPNDFLRLVNIRLSSWISARSSTIAEDSPAYRMQSNKWGCGNPSLPVVALVHRSSGRQLELYKASSDKDTLTAFTYVPFINSDAASVSISDQLADAFIYFVAGLTMTTFKEDVSNDFFKVGRSLLGLE